MIKSDMRYPEYGERQDVDTAPPVEVVSGLPQLGGQWENDLNTRCTYGMPFWSE